MMKLNNVLVFESWDTIPDIAQKCRGRRAQLIFIPEKRRHEFNESPLRDQIISNAGFGVRFYSAPDGESHG